VGTAFPAFYRALLAKHRPFSTTSVPPCFPAQLVSSTRTQRRRRRAGFFDSRFLLPSFHPSGTVKPVTFLVLVRSQTFGWSVPSGGRGGGTLRDRGHVRSLLSFPVLPRSCLDLRSVPLYAVSGFFPANPTFLFPHQRELSLSFPCRVERDPLSPLFSPPFKPRLFGAGLPPSFYWRTY